MADTLNSERLKLIDKLAKIEANAADKKAEEKKREAAEDKNMRDEYKQLLHKFVKSDTEDGQLKAGY